MGRCEAKMCRFIIYPAVAFSAFATGMFFAYLLFQPVESQDRTRINLTEAVYLEPSSVDNSSLNQQTGIESLISDKQKASMLFEPTLKSWLETGNVPRVVAPSNEIIKRIVATRLHRYQAPYLVAMANKSYRPSVLDLNGDGKSELAIMLNCNAPIGCELWIFREVKDDFEVILRTTSQLEKFKIRKTRSKRFFDIQTSYYLNDPASEMLKRMDEYKFDGHTYTLRGCSGLVNQYRDSNGDLHKLKRPVLEHYDDCC